MLLVLLKEKHFWIESMLLYSKLCAFLLKAMQAAVELCLRTDFSPPLAITRHSARLGDRVSLFIPSNILRNHKLKSLKEHQAAKVPEVKNTLPPPPICVP